jgi:phosphate-selective porin OprO/OprP
MLALASKRLSRSALLAAFLAITLSAWSRPAHCNDHATRSVSFENGIGFSHPDRAYQMNLRFRMQNLAELTTREDNPWESNRVEAQVRRLRLRLQGWALDPKLAFQLQLSFSRSDMDWSSTQFPNVVRDANITYSPILETDEQLAFSFGQGKLPGNRQRVISSGDLQFADRALVNRVFNFDRDFGFQALYRRPNWNVKAALSTGEGRNLPTASNLGLGWIGRIEALPLGTFTGNNDLQEGDLVSEPEPRLSLGYSAALFRDSNRAGGAIGSVFVDGTGTPIRRDQTVHYADALFKWRGFSLYSEAAYRSSPDGQINASRALFEGAGYLLQSGYFLVPGWEIAARYARVRPLDRSRIDSANRDTEQSTVGFTRYLNGHRVKLQSDLTRQTRHEPSWIARLNFELGI